MQANMSYPQMMTGQTIAVGDTVMRSIIDGRYTWQEFAAAEPSEGQYHRLGAAMMGAHKANKVWVWLGKKTRHYGSHQRVTPERLGLLVNGARLYMAHTVIQYAGVVAPDTLTAARESIVASTDERYRLDDDFQFHQAIWAGKIIEASIENGKPSPELQALGHLFAISHAALQPTNREAVDLKNDLRRDLRILYRKWPWWTTRKDRAARARLLEIPRRMRGIVGQAITLQQSAVEETLGRPLSADAKLAFLDGVIRDISVRRV
nr:MetaGeneMark_Unknown Function [uncultured bacterium]